MAKQLTREREESKKQKIKERKRRRDERARQKRQAEAAAAVEANRKAQAAAREEHAKRLIKAAEENGTSVPTELRNDYDKLKRKIDAEDVLTEGGPKAIDDEYATVGLYDPRVCVTTSR